MEYPKPRCPQCSTPLPLRTIIIKAILCWNCEETINVAAGYKDHLPMPQASFTRAERNFAHRHGVVLDRRYSHIAMTRYLANVCPRCDHMQGDWFIYFDPNRDVLSIERARRETHGPCDKCSTRSCPKHGTYIDYDDTGRCPHCLRAAGTVACSVRTDLLCINPGDCLERGCYLRTRHGRTGLLKALLSRIHHKPGPQSRH